MSWINDLNTSYWRVFRLVLVIFFLYLLGDVFYRWDGFRHNASFSEFLPSIALVSILWSFIAFLTSISIWLIVKVLEWLLQLYSRKVRAEHLFYFFIFFGVLLALSWGIKRHVLGGGSTLAIKLIVFCSVSAAAIISTWMCRQKFDIIQKNITPLVWLFSALIILSIPIVGFNTFSKQPNNVILHRVNKSLVNNTGRPNIILVTFDALTVENMSLYGYDRMTTPFIDKWAKGASVFTRAEAESSWTAPTTASLMTGKRAWTHQFFHPDNPYPVKSDTENLPLLLENSGYTTMSFVVNKKVASPERLGVAKNFQISPLKTDLSVTASLLGDVDVFLYKIFFNKIKLYDWILMPDFALKKIVDRFIKYDNRTVTQYPPEIAFNSFLKVLNKNNTEPFFAWIHLYPPHEPYLPPNPYIGTFNPSNAFRTHNSQSKVIMNSFKAIAKAYPSQDVQSIVDILRSRYDENIRYCDEQFKNFVEHLQKRDKLKNTIVILSSDHGESFEHNWVGHGLGQDGALYEEVTHIPLIIKEPDRNGGLVIHDLVEQIDITATILDMAHISIPEWIEGRSLVPLMRGKSLPSRPIFSILTRRPRGLKIDTGIIAVWEGDYKFIHQLRKNKDDELYNLKNDPDEMNNILDKEPLISRRLLGLIQDNLKKANQRIVGKKDLD